MYQDSLKKVEKDKYTDGYVFADGPQKEGFVSRIKYDFNGILIINSTKTRDACFITEKELNELGYYIKKVKNNTFKNVVKKYI